jgi:hypothetical protein
VTVLMDRCQQLLLEWGCWRHVQPPFIGHQVIDESPRSRARSMRQLFSEGDKRRIGGLNVVETCDEVEARRGDGQNSAACGVLFCVVAGEGIRHRVECPGLVFNGEIVAEKLAHPMMLWNRGEALIQQKFEVVVVCPHRETSAPKIRPPMPNGVHKADELVLVCCEGVMTRCHRPAEIGDGCLSWISTAPKPYVDASHSTTNGRAKFGSAKTGADVTAALSA